MRVVPVACLSDNYAYLIVRDNDDLAVVVDPSEAAPVLGALAREGMRPAAILNTHHHHDHVGGNEELCARFHGLKVFAHASDQGRIPRASESVEEGRRFTVAGFEFRPLHVPGHTRGAVTYVVEDAAFTGDTMFIAGCGRLFEGTPAEMRSSLEKIACLPPATRIFPGHEYTVSNLRFAVHVEPENRAAEAKLGVAREQRDRGESTVPSTIADELATNPFLRTDEPTIRGRFPGASAASVFASLRRAKDTFQ